MTPIHRILDGLSALWRTLTALDGDLSAASEAMHDGPPPVMGDTHSRKVPADHWTAAMRRARCLPNRATSDAMAANLLIAATGNGTVRVVEEERA